MLELMADRRQYSISSRIRHRGRLTGHASYSRKLGSHDDQVIHRRLSLYHTPSQSLARGAQGVTESQKILWQTQDSELNLSH